jgi:hypothetical protein
MQKFSGFELPETPQELTLLELQNQEGAKEIALGVLATLRVMSPYSSTVLRLCKWATTASDNLVPHVYAYTVHQQGQYKLVINMFGNIVNVEIADDNTTLQRIASQANNHTHDHFILAC